MKYKLKSIKKQYQSEPYKGMNSCNIDYSVLPVPRLKQACRGQYDIKGPKCFKNVCYKVNKVLSSSAGNESFLGNVVLIDNVVIKWNRSPKERENMLMELKIQNIAHTLGLAPKILDAYEDGKYFFIVMTNLTKQGYKSVYDLFMKEILDEYWNGGNLGKIYIPEEVLILIAQGLDQLHEYGFIHGDLHPNNVFYNPNKHKIMFIDFGLSRHFKSKEEAIENERFKFSEWLTYMGKGSTMPKNWMNISKYIEYRDLIRIT